ncbi:MAG: hypothetical protein KatS3mg023_3650 [Armatimonadota bacterium]|nr:MAG: hypothetical protein KatS3mg023_3650 [Armatimonadota bacterium]
MQPLSNQAPDEVRRTGCSDDALSIDTASHQLCAVDMYEQMFNQVGSTYLKLRRLCDSHGLPFPRIPARYRSVRFKSAGVVLELNTTPGLLSVSYYRDHMRFYLLRVVRYVEWNRWLFEQSWQDHYPELQSMLYLLHSLLCWLEDRYEGVSRHIATRRLRRPRRWQRFDQSAGSG